jgi:hypothetical protein
MKYILSILVFTVVLAQLGCNKKERAGYGGNANLKLVAKHHGLVIDSVTFYVKFDATDAPSESSYDITQKGITIAPGNTSVTITGLKKGDYYIYAKGWDPSISNDVKGGIPFKITEEKDYDVIVAVTEIH